MSRSDSHASAPRIFMILFTLGPGAALAAEEFEQHQAHEHGRVTLNIAVEGAELVIELEAPAINVVGFEHAPRNTGERAAAANAAALLRDGGKLFVLPAEAQCRLEKAELVEPVWDKGEEAHESHGEDHEEHSDYEARYGYRCAQPARLAWLEPALLGSLHDVTEATVNLVTPDGQRSETVKNPRTRIALGRP
jgi:hypothetical protein